MKDGIEFHSTQIEAIDFLIDGINQNKKVIALIGAGGTGKSEVLSELYKRYDGSKVLHFSATTNKAVSRLLEVLPKANTIHSLTTKPNYTALYKELDEFFKSFKSISEKEREQFSKDFPFSINAKGFLKGRSLTPYRSLQDLLSALKMNSFSKEMFNGYIVKERIPSSVLIIDESSMLPTKSEYYEGSLVTVGLDTAERVFSSVILVGDSSQLPPINGKSSFDDVESYELTKNFRSEKDLLEAIQYAREGKWFGKFESKSKNVRVVNGINKKWYEKTFKRPDVAHIVYRNKTRHDVTKTIREGHNGHPLVGEPIMLRGRGSNSVQKGEIGVFNGLEIEFEKDNVKIGRWDRFDEYTEKYGRYQFGYAITCHLAQGSAFENVIIHLYDIPSFIDEETKRQWIYTAVSRVRKTLTIIL